MNNLLLGIAVLLMITAFPTSASADTCTANLITVKEVCGVVLDGTAVPIRGATVHIQAADGKWLAQPVWTETDGQFCLTGVPQGESILAVTVTEFQQNSWSLRRVLIQPLKVTAMQTGCTCSKPLVVHMTGRTRCGDWVEKK